MNKNKSKMQQILFNFYKKTVPYTIVFSTFASIVSLPPEDSLKTNYGTQEDSLKTNYETQLYFKLIHYFGRGFFIGATYPISFPLISLYKCIKPINENKND